MIPDNNIGDEGMKYLTDSMCTMKHLTILDISRNNITSDGVKTLLNAYEKPTRPVCQTLEDIDLSGNPISDVGFKAIFKLSQYLKLKVLKLNKCNVTDNVVSDGNKLNASLDVIEVFDISNNLVKQIVVNSVISILNPNTLTDLELDNIGVEGNVAGCIASFMDTAKDLKIRRFGLSNCKLVDGQFMRIFRLVFFLQHSIIESVLLKLISSDYCIKNLLFIFSGSCCIKMCYLFLSLFSDLSAGLSIYNR